MSTSNDPAKKGSKRFAILSAITFPILIWAYMTIDKSIDWFFYHKGVAWAVLVVATLIWSMIVYLMYRKGLGGKL